MKLILRYNIQNHFARNFAKIFCLNRYLTPLKCENQKWHTLSISEKGFYVNEANFTLLPKKQPKSVEINQFFINYVDRII